MQEKSAVITVLWPSSSTVDVHVPLPAGSSCKAC